jgi:hypothetical protein
MSDADELEKMRQARAVNREIAERQERERREAREARHAELVEVLEWCWLHGTKLGINDRAFLAAQLVRPCVVLDGHQVKLLRAIHRDIARKASSPFTDERLWRMGVGLKPKLSLAEARAAEAEARANAKPLADILGLKSQASAEPITRRF